MRHSKCNERESFTIRFMGRGGSGPWDRQGRGRDHPHGHGHDEMHTGRILGHGDLRFVILALLADQPSHGYELIKAIGDRSSGQYVPSPGVIYPTLTFLQEGGFATVTSDNGKNLYTITDEGRVMLDENKEAVETIFLRMQKMGERMSRMHEWVGKEDEAFKRGRKGQEENPIRAGFHALKSILSSRMPISDADQKAIGVILANAAEAIQNLKATKE